MNKQDQINKLKEAVSMLQITCDLIDLPIDKRFKVQAVLNEIKEIIRGIKYDDSAKTK